MNALTRASRLAITVAACAWLPWALATVADLDTLTWHIPAAGAFLPYVALCTALTCLVAALLRAWRAVAIAALGVAVLVAPRIDRARAADQPIAHGPTITVATSNVYVGEGNMRQLANLVRGHHVDILAIQENTPESDTRLAARIATQLPYRLTEPDPRPGAAGLAVLSRWPIQRIAPNAGDHRSLGGLIRIPGASRPLHLRSVHPPPPFNPGNMRCWRRCTRTLAQTLRPGTHTILAGDYNATLDHHPLRDLLAAGLRDAANETGDAWRPTWTRNRLIKLPIDHILISHDIAATQVTAHDLARSDHDVVITRLQLPR